MSLRRLPWLMFALTFHAFAHSEGEAPSAGILDCDHPPQDIARALPNALSQAASVVCTPSAQMIIPGPDWVWRFPGSFFDRPSIPAYSPVESRSQAGGRYFTGFEASELETGEIRKLHDRFVKTLGTYTEERSPERIVKLVANNDQGHAMEAYFGFKSATEGWVALCAPQCVPEFFFLINRLH